MPGQPTEAIQCTWIRITWNETDSCLNLRGEAPSAVDQEIGRASLVDSSSHQMTCLLPIGCNLQGLLDQRLQSSVLLRHTKSHITRRPQKLDKSRPVLHWRNSVRLGSLACQACGMLCRASLCHGTGGVFATRAGRGSSPPGASVFNEFERSLCSNPPGDRPAICWLG